MHAVGQCPVVYLSHLSLGQEMADRSVAKTAATINEAIGALEDLEGQSELELRTQRGKGWQERGAAFLMPRAGVCVPPAGLSCFPEPTVGTGTDRVVRQAVGVPLLHPDSFRP